MTTKQLLFCMEYLANNGNATAAYRAAGYAPAAAEVSACQLLRNPKVVAFLEPRLAKRVAKLELKAERLDEELARCAFIDPANLFDENGAVVRDLSKLPEDTRRAVRGVKVREIFEWEGEGDERKKVHVGDLVEVKLEPKTEAIGLAYRRLGLLKDKVMVTSPGTGDPREIPDEEWAALAKLMHQVRDA